MYKKLALLLFVLSLSISAFAQKDLKTNDSKDVLAVIDKLFENMAGHNPAEIVALHTADAQLVVLFKQADETSRIQTIKAEQFSKNFAEKKAELKELMYEHKTEVHGDLALVSGRYVFFVNDKVSHCGVNAFHLVRTVEGWRIAGASSTIEPKGCTEKELKMKAN